MCECSIKSQPCPRHIQILRAQRRASDWCSLSPTSELCFAFFNLHGATPTRRSSYVWLNHSWCNRWPVFRCRRTEIRRANRTEEDGGSLSHNIRCSTEGLCSREFTALICFSVHTSRRSPAAFRRGSPSPSAGHHHNSGPGIV